MNKTAAQPLDLDRLEALARNVMAGKTTLERLEALHDWQGACDPATILALIAQARAARLDTTASAELAPLPNTELAARLAEYASNPGYSWNDYADTMKQASDAIHAVAKWNEARASLAPVAAPVQIDEGVMLHLSRELITALKRLSFAAQTTGGTAGPDAELQAAIVQAEQALSLGAVARAMSAAEAAPVAAQQAASEKLPIELRGIAEEVAEGSGFWHSCSGCHESNEGCPTGPHSAVFGCALGNGCSECGGIGAVWDNTDYEAMVAEMHDNISAGAATTSQDAPAEREYEIWADGYCESGTEGRKTEPYLWGKQVGTDFLDACRNFARRDASFARYLHISDGVATAYTTLYPYNPARRATQQEGGK